ncbi:MAG: DNA-directed RNA polymerase subunit alpha C-terminal domain-containing protein [Oscillospiraceae bacterium]
MKNKEYPQNLLSQVFVNGLPTEMPDDVTLVLEYIIQKTLTEREGRVLDMRYKRYMTMAAIGEECGLRAERIRQIEAKAVRKLRHPSRSRYILMGMEGYINYLRDTAVDERLREYKKEIISLEKKIAELTDTEYEEEKNELENAPLAELDLSVRTFNILYRAGYTTVRELLDADAEKIVSLPNLGLKNFSDLIDMLSEKGFGWKSAELSKSYSRTKV